MDNILLTGTSVWPGENGVINCFCDIGTATITVQLDITILAFGLEQPITTASKCFIAKGDIQVICLNISNLVLTIHAIMQTSEKISVWCNCNRCSTAISDKRTDFHIYFALNTHGAYNAFETGNGNITFFVVDPKIEHLSREFNVSFFV